jgi:hypothetical protein
MGRMGNDGKKTGVSPGGNAGMSRARVRSGSRAVALSSVAWSRIILGFVLAIAAGAGFAFAWVGELAVMWGVSAVALLVGGALMAVGVCAARPPSEMLLGALLVYKYRLITEEQLDVALAEQIGPDGTERRLGEILLEMGLVTEPQLAEALEFQQRYLRHRGGAREVAQGA